MHSRRTVLLAAYLLFAGFFYYITFVQFGLLTLARTRLGVKPEELPIAMGLLTAGGFTACVVTSRWLEHRGAAIGRRLRLIAYCSGIEAVLALLALRITSPGYVTALCIVLGVILGANSVVTVSLVFDGLPHRTRWLACGWIVALIYLVANIPPLVFAQPQRIIAFNALVAGITALLAWQSQELRAIPPAAAWPTRHTLHTWLPFLLTIVLLDSYTFQRLLTDHTLWALTWGTDRHIWVNGIVHAVGAIGAGGLAQRRGGPRLAGAIAALSLIATHALLLAGAAAIGGGYVFTAVYNTGVSAYFVLLLGLWPACCGPRPDSRLGWALALTCWVGAPTGIGLATLIPATSVFAFGLPLAGAATALVWLYVPRTSPAHVQVQFAKETS